MKNFPVTEYDVDSWEDNELRKLREELEDYKNELSESVQYSKRIFDIGLEWQRRAIAAEAELASRTKPSDITPIITSLADLILKRDVIDHDMTELKK